MRILPTFVWGIFQDNHTLALYCPCCGNITMDAIKREEHKGAFWYFRVLYHEAIHHLFNLMPSKGFEFCSKLLDVTDGNQPWLVHGIDQDQCVVLYVWQ